MQKPDLNRILIVQTAFAGDVVLTLPLVQILKNNYPSSKIDFVTIPRVADVLKNHPAINDVIIFDKRNKDAGILGLFKIVNDLKKSKYDIAFVPHRSIRSALLVRLSGIKKRIGFDKSSGKYFFTDVVHYEQFIHEIDRNLSLLKPIGIEEHKKVFPRLYPSDSDREQVSKLLMELRISNDHRLIGIAPGSVWNTKRWLKERFVELSSKLITQNYKVVLIGGADDSELCQEIKNVVASNSIQSASGKLTLLQSAELIRRCSVMITNDSAPMHLAVSMDTPVVAIFGATVPAFGFAPYGERDMVVEINGLDCRPCGIHGGNKCPIKTFDCMKRISADEVYEKVIRQIKFSEKQK